MLYANFFPNMPCYYINQFFLNAASEDRKLDISSHTLS